MTDAEFDDYVKFNYNNDRNSLNIFHTRLRTLPRSILKLKQLRELDLSNSDIVEIPDFITQLKFLDKIAIYNCKHLKRAPNTAGYYLFYDQIKSLKISPTNVHGLAFVDEVNYRDFDCLDICTNVKSIAFALEKTKIELPKKIYYKLNNLKYVTELSSTVPFDIKLLSSSFISQLVRLALNYDDFVSNFKNTPPGSLTKIELLTLFPTESITTINLDISSLVHLKELSFWGRWASKTSIVLWEHLKFPNIEKLNLGALGCRNSQLLFNLLPSSLVKLEIDGCGFENQISYHLPKNIVDVKIRNCELQFVPENIEQLHQLRSLDLSSNKIKVVPQSVTKLQSLEVLVLSGNPLIVPPLEVLNNNEFNNLDSINRYFSLKKSEDFKKLYEAKMLIIGEGGVGKSTLANKIIDSDYRLRKGSTDGISILKYSFETQDNNPYYVNIWDFGGQEIYHSTHQFFLTKDSLYVLVDDGRENKTDFFYWLRIVELLSDNSPLLIVQNRKEGKGGEINVEPLRAEYAHLISPVYYTNLEVNEKLEDIIREVKHQLLGLDHIGIKLPASFPRIREKLEQLANNYISEDELKNVCRSEGIFDEKDFELLSDVFHKIGVFLHFREDNCLRNLVILKHEWATDAVYKVLDNGLVKDINKGRFTESDARDIWSDDKYSGKYYELLMLMKKFNVAYEIKNSPNYVVPHLLPFSKPEYEWVSVGNITLKYLYKFMPKGLVNRFTVEMYDYIYKNIVWKEGVIIFRDNTFAEIIERWHDREIQIRVRGQFKKEFLTLITEKFKEIHKPYRTKPELLIPCNCKICASSEIPHFYQYNKLRDFLSNGRNEVQCDNPPYETLKIEPLIEDVLEFIPSRMQMPYLSDTPKERLSQEEKYKSEIKISGDKELISELITHKEMTKRETEPKSTNSAKSKPDLLQPTILGLILFGIIFGAILLIGKLGLPYWLIPIIIISFIFLWTLITLFSLLVSGHLQEKSFVDITKIVFSKTPGLSWVSNFISKK